MVHLVQLLAFRGAHAAITQVEIGLDCRVEAFAGDVLSALVAKVVGVLLIAINELVAHCVGNLVCPHATNETCVADVNSDIRW